MPYTYPIGIPSIAPSFGFDVDTATPGWPASWLTGTTSATAGYYYIDKTDPAATNTANPYGHPDLPRSTPPQGLLAEGAFVYIHAGTYTGADNDGDRFDWYGVGTSENPIWITGNPATHPIIQDFVHIGTGGNTSFLVFENIDIGGHTAAHIELRPTTNGHSIDHILIRNCVLTGTQSSDDYSGIEIGISQSDDTIPDSTISYVCVYSCTVSNYGNKSTSDDGGIGAGFHTHHIWVLNNVVHDVGSDSIAGSHYSNYTDRLCEYYYIGGNTCYGNGENGIDVKNARYVVISENEIYGPFTREQGWGIVLHYGALTDFRDRDVWVIFNRIHHVSGGIYTGTSSGADNLNIVGNLIYDVHSAYAAEADSLNGAAIQLGGSDGTFRITDNTFHDCDRGINLASLDGTDAVEIHGNIFSEISGYVLVVVNGQEGFVSSNYNLYTGTPSFFWLNASRNLAYMQGTAGVELNSIGGDPDFANAAGGNFALLLGSPAIDVGIEGEAYAAFLALFSESIQFDFDGVSRPQNGDWDIGALEYVGVVGTSINITTLNATTLTVG